MSAEEDPYNVVAIAEKTDEELREAARCYTQAISRKKEQISCGTEDYVRAIEIVEASASLSRLTQGTLEKSGVPGDALSDFIRLACQIRIREADRVIGALRTHQPSPDAAWASGQIDSVSDTRRDDMERAVRAFRRATHLAHIRFPTRPDRVRGWVRLKLHDILSRAYNAREETLRQANPQTVQNDQTSSAIRQAAIRLQALHILAIQRQMLFEEARRDKDKEQSLIIALLNRQQKLILHELSRRKANHRREEEWSAWVQMVNAHRRAIERARGPAR